MFKPQHSELTAARHFILIDAIPLPGGFEMSRQIVSYFVMALLVIVMFWSVGSSAATAETTGSYIPHAAIAIYENGGFTSGNGVVRGSGTAEDPFIIEGWEISSSSGGGITIWNADVHFVIQDCYVHDCRGYAVYLRSCFNGMIRNCTCTGVSYGLGIYLYSSDDNRLINNTCSNNEWGILLQLSDDNTLSNNTCSNNVRGMGIDFWSEDNTLSNNTCSDNYYNGIFLGWSSDNTLSNNTCSSNNVLEGIRIDSSNYNTICNNTCSSNGEDGILLWIWSGGTSSGNTVCNNTCSNNVLVGIELVSSSDTSVSNNTCSYNGDEGIWLDSSSGNTLDNNSCMSNYLDGIGIGSSSDNILSDNNCSSNGEQGIWLGTWSGLGNLPGSLSNNNKIARNQLCSNSGYGVYIDSGSNNRIWNNTFCNNNGAKDVYDRNHVQAFDSGTGNWWSSSDGYGNRWCDWRGPDLTPADGDGIVDYPYHIDGKARSYDYYPLATSSPDPWTLTDALIKTIQSWDFPKGTTTGLTSKLFEATELLERGNVNGALHNLMDFVSTVHAMEGKHQLESWQADYALTSAEAIIGLLT